MKWISDNADGEAGNTWESALAAGQEEFLKWFNSGKCMITVHRDDLTYYKADLYFNKIKPRSNGKIGKHEIFFDKEKLVYFEQEQQGNTLIKKYAKAK